MLFKIFVLVQVNRVFYKWSMHVIQIHKSRCAFPRLCFCLLTISLRALLINYKVCFGKPYWKCMDGCGYTDFISLASVSYVTIYGCSEFFKGMLGVVQLAEQRRQCSTLPLHQVSHYSKNSSQRNSPKNHVSYQSRGKNCVVCNIQHGGTNMLTHIKPYQKKSQGEEGKLLAELWIRPFWKSSRALSRKGETWGKWENETEKYNTHEHIRQIHFQRWANCVFYIWFRFGLSSTDQCLACLARWVWHFMHRILPSSG